MQKDKTEYFIEWKTYDGHWTQYTGVMHKDIIECEDELARMTFRSPKEKFRIVERNTKEQVFPLRCPVCHRDAVVQLPFLEHRVGCKENCIPMVKNKDRDVAVGLWNESVTNYMNGGIT